MLGFIYGLVLEAIVPRTCKTCYVPLGINHGVYEYCNNCTLNWFLLETNRVSKVLSFERFNSVWTVAGFRMKEGATKEIIYMCKYSGRPKLLSELGRWFAKNNPLPHDDVVLVPIPLHWKRKLKRGYNQAEKLAHGMAEVWKVEVDRWSLKRGVHKTSLTGSNRRVRSKSVKDVFYYKDGFCDTETPIILIDDVLTTGATLRSCRNVLEENKRIVLGAAVLALA